MHLRGGNDQLAHCHHNRFVPRFSIWWTTVKGITFLPRFPRGAKSNTSAPTARRRLYTVPREQRHLSASSAKEKYSGRVGKGLWAFSFSCGITNSLLYGSLVVQRHRAAFAASPATALLHSLCRLVAFSIDPRLAVLFQFVGWY